MNELLRNNKHRAKAVIIILCAYLLIKVCYIVSCYMEYDLLFRVKNYGHILTDEKVYSNDLRQKIIVIINLLGYLTTVITFLFWFRRAYYNLETCINFTNYTNSQTVYYWFIPILALYKPYRIMEDMFVQTDTVLEEGIEHYRPKTSLPLLRAWWVFWIINCFYSYIIFRFPYKGIDGFMSRDICVIISCVVDMIAGIFLLRVIRKYHLMELQLRDVRIACETNIEVFSEEQHNVDKNENPIYWEDD